MDTNQSWLIIKEDKVEEAHTIFQGTGIAITAEGKRHQGAVKHGIFSLLVFTAAGGIGPTATVVYKRLASRIAEKHDRAYGKTLHLIRCRLNTFLLRSATMCLRGYVHYYMYIPIYVRI